MSYAESGDELEEVAATWAVRLDRGPLSEQDQRALDTWLAGDTRRLGALVRAQAVWCDIDRLAAMERAGIDTSLPPVRQRDWRPWRLAACMALALVCVGGLISSYLYEFAGREQARLGEIRRIVLQDGSVVVLNTDTVMQVRYRADERDIYLRKGEASFQVAHNRARPFIVHAGPVSVRAVGTSFAVRERSGGVLVTVAEGVVEVARKSGSGAGSLDRRYLRRDYQLLAAPDQPLKTTALSDELVARELSWREGLLMFNGETMGEAVKEVNRYSPTPVVIDDPRLAQRAFVGVFQAGDAKSFATAAAAAFNARMTESPDGAIHLQSGG